jgi:hypothetical protein
MIGGCVSGRCLTISVWELPVLGFFAGYVLVWNSPGAISFTKFTSDPTPPPGVNLFTSIALSRHNVSERGGIAVVGIDSWRTYGASGAIIGHDVPNFSAQNSAFINSCRDVTYVLAVESGAGAAQISLSTL